MLTAGEVCAICLQDTVENPVLVEGCFHVYCAPCLWSWVTKNGQHEARCPLCKLDIQTLVTEVESNEVYCIVTLDAFRCGLWEVEQRKRDRRRVYAQSLEACPIPDVRLATVTPDRVTAHQQRALQWVERDLQVLLHHHDVSLLASMCVDIASADGIPSSKLDSFLLDHITPEQLSQFTPSLVHFLETPLGMQAYDAKVKYRPIKT